MAGDPADRYATAHDLAADLRPLPRGPPRAGPARRLPIRPGPTRRAPPRGHRRVGAAAPRLSPRGPRLREAYRRLDSREGDWILGSRVLSFSQIALYLGAFLLACGGVLYFGAYLERTASAGSLHPLRVPGLAARRPRGAGAPSRPRRAQGDGRGLPPGRRRARAAAPAHRPQGGIGWLTTLAAEGRELFERVTNRQLQAALALSAAWSRVPRPFAPARWPWPAPSRSSSPRSTSRSSGTSACGSGSRMERWDKLGGRPSALARRGRSPGPGHRGACGGRSSRSLSTSWRRASS